MCLKVLMMLPVLQYLSNYGDCSYCNSNLITGPEGVADESITASTTHRDCGTTYVRLDAPSGRSWCPATPSNLDYLQIEFPYVSWLRSITTRGRGAHGQFVNTYHMKVSNDGINWKYVRDTSGSIKEFPANDDQSTLVERNVEETIITKFIRIYPQTWMSWPSIRLEIKGCPYTPSKCWKAILGSQGESLPIVHQTVTVNNGFCGRACHRYPTCESFLYTSSSNLCQLLGNDSSIDSSSIMTDLNKKFYFVQYASCAFGQ